MAGRLSETRTNGHRPRPQPPRGPTAVQLVEAEQLRQKRRMAALSAAGRQIDVTTRDGRKLLRKPRSWQEDVWTYYDTVPEVKFTGRFFGNSLSRIRLYAGIIVDPDEPPVPVDDAVEDGTIGLPEAVAAAANDEVDRLSQSADGMAGIMRGFGECLSMVGECYLLGRDALPDDDVVGDEFWQVYSTSAVTEKDDQVMVQETPDSRPVPLPAGSDPLVYRIWRRHARWPGLADSNMGAVLDELEELIIYGRLLRSIGRSQTMAGIYKLPAEADLGAEPRATDPGGNSPPVPPSAQDGDATPDDGLTDLERTLMTSWVHAAENEGSPASVAPFLLRAKAEHLKAAGFDIPNRPIDDKIIERMDFLIRRIAHGADLPVEVLTGVADANHWTGWQIEDSTYKAHVEPTAQIPAAALTAVFLRPALEERGVSMEWLPRIAIGLDPSALVVRPNRGQDAQEVFDAYGLSWDALRRHRNFPDADAPTAQEVVLRAALQGNTVVIPGTTPMTQSAPPAIGPAPDPGDGQDGQQPEDGGPPQPDDSQADQPDQQQQEAARTAVLLAASRVVVPGLGDQLTSIEARLRDRIQQAAADELRQVLRRAGNRLRAAAQGDPKLKRKVNGTDPESVGQLLGADQAAELASVDELLDGAFDPLRVKWDAWVPEAEAAAITAAVKASDVPDGVQSFDSQAQESDDDAGWTALFLGLMALARTRLFEVADEPDGEALADVGVPAGLVRDALAVAGGGQAASVPHGPAAASGPPGLLTGPRWRAALRQLELEPNKWEWRTGFPTKPFLPHQDLAGVVFADWADEQLTAGAGFPPVSHYYPGDHNGCLCDAVPVFTKTGGTLTLDQEGD